MVATDLKPWDESHDLSRYARRQLATVPHRYIALSTLKHLYMWLAGRQLAIGPQLVHLPILSTLSSPMDLCSNRLLGLKDVLHEADCGVRPRVNLKVLKCCVHYISTREVALGSRSPFWRMAHVGMRLLACPLWLVEIFLVSVQTKYFVFGEGTYPKRWNPDPCGLGKPYETLILSD